MFAQIIFLSPFDVWHVTKSSSKGEASLVSRTVHFYCKPRRTDKVSVFIFLQTHSHQISAMKNVPDIVSFHYVKKAEILSHMAELEMSC